MKNILLTAKLAKDMQQHGIASYPHECCGFMLGKRAGDDIHVAEILAAENQRTDSLHNRYAISPKEYLQAEKLADSRGLELVGFYHSHPDHPAIPSQFDLDHAWPNLIYAIAAIRQGRAEAFKAYTLTDDRNAFREIAMQLAQD